MKPSRRHRWWGVYAEVGNHRRSNWNRCLQCVHFVQNSVIFQCTNPWQTHCNVQLFSQPVVLKQRHVVSINMHTVLLSTRSSLYVAARYAISQARGTLSLCKMSSASCSSLKLLLHLSVVHVLLCGLIGSGCFYFLALCTTCLLESERANRSLYGQK